MTAPATAQWALATAIVLGVATAQAADPVTHLKKLDAYVGTWKGTISGGDQAVESKTTWVLNKKFVRQLIEMGDGTEIEIMRGFNSYTGDYQASFFHSSGLVFHVAGNWDGNTLTMRGTLNESTVEVKSSFPAPNREEWTISLRNGDQDSFLLTGINERVD